LPGGKFLFLRRQEKEPKEGEPQTLPFGFPPKQMEKRETKELALLRRCSDSFRF
jgi:hypothetical protein